MNIPGQKFLITGGCGALGLAAATELLERGKSVVLCDKNVSRGRALEQESKSVTLIACDLADATDIERQVGPLVQGADPPDVLVNAVGWSPKTDRAGRPLTIEHTDAERWDAVFATNVTSYFLCARQVAPSMASRRYGRIVHIGSYVARMGGTNRNSVVYVASKAAIQGMTVAMARELAPANITVNLIQPGRIKTAMNADVSAGDTAEFLKRIALARLGAPRDVVGAILYLVSDLADYVTGATLNVDGGLYMGP